MKAAAITLAFVGAWCGMLGVPAVVFVTSAAAFVAGGVVGVYLFAQEVER